MNDKKSCVRVEDGKIIIESKRIELNADYIVKYLNRTFLINSPKRGIIDVFIVEGEK